MLFKSAISLLSAAIILSTELAGASSSRLERNAQDGSSKIDAGATALRRKLKKDEDDDKSSKDDKDTTDVAPSNEEDKDGEVVQKPILQSAQLVTRGAAERRVRVFYMRDNPDV